MIDKLKFMQKEKNLPKGARHGEKEEKNVQKQKEESEMPFFFKMVQ